MAEEGYLIGVDGGGTKTKAVAARMDGTVLAAAMGGGLNAGQIGAEQAKENLLDVLSRLTRGLNGQIARVVVGDPSLDGPAPPEAARAFAQGWIEQERLTLTSDVHLALFAFSQGAPAAMAVCGTGSMIVMTDEDGETRTAGGWGHVLGDPGSGYALALGGLRAAIDCWEGVSDARALAERARAFFDLREPRGLIDFVYRPETKPSDLAAFGREVLALAKASDEPALGLLCAQMTRLARGAAALIRPCPAVRRVGLYGGVFEHSAEARDAFTQALREACPNAETARPALPPEIGGVMLAMRECGGLNEKAIKRLKETSDKE